MVPSPPSGLDEGMKRTITLQVEADDFDQYATAVAAIIQHPEIKIAKMSWTRGEEIKEILERDHGIGADWGSGSVHDGFGLRGSK